MMKQKHLAVIVGAMLAPTFALAQSADRVDALIAQVQAMNAKVQAMNAEIASLKAAQSAPAAQASGVSASDKKNTVKIGTNAEVTLYGRVMAQVENVKVSNNWAGTSTDHNLTKNRVSAHNSNIGFKGEMDVGNGTAAFFQIEQRAPIDGTADSSFANRNSGVGFKGPWGTALVGRWNTPYKDQTIKVDPFNETTLAANTFVMGQVSQLGDDDIFHARLPNTIQYWTPKVNGFSGKVFFTANEEKTTTTNPYTTSLTLDYDQGPLFALVGYETHKDSGALTATATGKDKGMHVGGGYRFSQGTTISAIWEKLSFHSDAIVGTAAADMSRNAWFLGASHKFNQVSLRGGYGRAGNQSGTNAMLGGNSETGAKGFYGIVGYALNGWKALDKTEVFAQYVRLNNDRNASYIVTNSDTNAGAGGLNMTKAGANRWAGATFNAMTLGVMTYF
ncbi:MAG: porin [Rhodocyclales bacterium]|nr:porin [Rhodocyclales bacterium]